MDAPEIAFFSKKRTVTRSPSSGSDASSPDGLQIPNEMQFGSQLTAFQSMEATDDEVLEIIKSVGPSAREMTSMNSMSSTESWASFQSFGPRCQRCGNPCGDDVVYFENLTYHKRHFTCKKCNQPLVEPVLIGNEVYCLICSQGDSPLPSPEDQGCNICRKPFCETSVIVAGKCYCKDHFRCATCHKPLTIDNYRQRKGHIYCVEHAPQRPFVHCSECGGEITDKSINALGQNFHPSCFCCVLCKENLANKVFTAWKNKPLCQECFKKLPNHVKIAITKGTLRGA